MTITFAAVTNTSLHIVFVTFCTILHKIDIKHVLLKGIYAIWVLNFPFTPLICSVRCINFPDNLNKKLHVDVIKHKEQTKYSYFQVLSSQLKRFKMAVWIIIIAQIMIALWFYLNNNLLPIGKKLFSYHCLWKDIVRIHSNLIKKNIRYLIWVATCISLLPFWKTSDLKCLPRMQI